MSKLKESKRRPLIIGLGNVFRGDDALGIEFVNTMKSRYPNAADYHIESGDCLELPGIWKERDTIVVDAVHTHEQMAGRIHTFESLAELSLASEQMFSTHGFGLKEAIGLAEQLGKLPNSMLVVGVEGVSWDIGARFSDETASAFPGVEDLVMSRVVTMADSM